MESMEKVIWFIERYEKYTFRTFVSFCINMIVLPKSGLHSDYFWWFSAWNIIRISAPPAHFFGVCSPGWWCMFCSGRLCRQARKWFLCARKDAGGGARLCVNTHLVFGSLLALHLLITSTFKNSISCLPLFLTLACCSVAGISVNLGHPQGRALKSTLNFLDRIPCLSLIGIDL
jgi:hypothetical protein